MSQFDLMPDDELRLLEQTLRTLGKGFSTLPAVANAHDYAAMQAVLESAAERMHDNYPYAHPLYAGQMLKPPHPVARIAYQMAMSLNPNNHALDGGRASSAMEKEAVVDLASMFGLADHLGHLTSSGTIANLEALWIAGQERPGQLLGASVEAHYTHRRISEVLGLEFAPIAVDGEGRLDCNAVEALAAEGRLGTVVATAGTTSFGVVDPVDKIVALAERYGFRVHVDAAYGGYFSLLDSLPATTQAAYAAIKHADSVAIDPHKHGLQPYGCGCVLFADAHVGKHYKHDSPYTYFSSNELHLGEISLECSRAGAAATALWSTQQLLPLRHDGVFAGMLDACINAARSLAMLLEKEPLCVVVQPPELDIVVWAIQADTGTEASARAQRVFELAAESDLHLALIEVDSNRIPQYADSSPTVTCLRSCLMKPEHEQWIDRIWAILQRVTQQVVRERGNA
ncbi:MAG: aminotransferase class V-fold PLP-dependent enzyme [Pseudomonadota bacterium]